MALQNFIKTVWAANLMSSLRKSHVFASVANTQYQGQLVNLGDKVKVMQISDVTINSYAKDTDITTEDLDDAALEIIADQPYYFSFKANDIEAVQQKPEVLRSATDQAAYGFADKVDQYFAGLYAQAGLSSGTAASPWDVNSLNVEDVLLDVTEKMARVPKQGRFVIVPQWFYSKLILAGLATKQDNNAIFTNGLVDRVMGFDVLVSENVSASNTTTRAETRILAGVRGQSMSFADAIAKIEPFRPEKRFEDAVKGLYVFGGKIMRPDMTCVVYADKTAEA